MSGDYQKLKDIVAKLRNPQGGCPWDLAQTAQSLKPYFVEECFEAIEAITKEDPEQTAEELGDVLLQIALHSQLAAEKQQFTLDSVIERLNAKLITRHPHVFNQQSDDYQQVQSAEDVAKKWQERKLALHHKEESFIKDKVLYNTALRSAQIIGEKTAKVHFDWDSANQVQYKVEEEWQELKEEMTAIEASKTPTSPENHARISEELGDLLFSIVQLARHLDIDAEDCLKQANRKFLTRFRSMEDMMNPQQKNHMTELTQNDWEQLWNLAKKREYKK
jgi:MazG family protein